MKLLLVHNHYQQPGGEDKVFESEKVLLKKLGHPVSVYERHNDEIISYFFISKLGLIKKTIWAKNSFRSVRNLVKQERPDVAHFHNTFLLISPSAYYACRGMGVPVVQTLHNYRLICPTATFFRNQQVCEECLPKALPWPGILHACYRGSRPQTAVVVAMLASHRWRKTWKKQVDVFIALTEFARRKFVAGGLPASKILVKPNFLHPDPGVRKGNERFVIFLGRLSPEKGIWTLLKGWEYLEEIPLKIIGDGPLMDEARAFLAIQKSGFIEVLGRRSHEEALELIKRAHFLVFPSEWYEGFPLTIAEAFACGVPVIASRLGSVAEIVEDGRTGLHFTPGDPEDLAAKVEWAWSHPREMREMGKEARREYEEKYTAERNYQMLMEIYQKAIENKELRD